MSFKAFITILNLLKQLSRRSRRRRSAITGPFRLLPQELLDLIISYFHNGKASLFSCVLVHPTWTSVSRRHLPHLTLFVSTPSPARKLVKLLGSSRETISSSVTGINLIGEAPVDGIPTTSRAQSYYIELLHLLKGKKIILRSGDVVNDPHFVQLLTQDFPDLVELKMTCASFKDLARFIRPLVGAFPGLTNFTIELSGDALNYSDSPLAGFHNLKLAVPCLRTLCLIGWNNELVRWLGDNVVGTLASLELRSYRLCRFREAQTLLQGNGKTLKDVKLFFTMRGVEYDLSALSCLENLEVTTVIGKKVFEWRSCLGR